jgi:hypothetical protein
MFVTCLYDVLPCVGLCDGLITRPKESYRVLIRLLNFRGEAAKVLTRTVEPLMMMMMMMYMTLTCSSLPNAML